MLAMPDVTVEHMNSGFTKYHLGWGRAIHHFTNTDLGWPHDHPASFISQILFGGYAEIVYRRNADGVWENSRVERLPGDQFFVEATHIHQIVQLFDSYCLTAVQMGDHERETRSWRFDGGVARSKLWNSEHWEVVK